MSDSPLSDIRIGKLTSQWAQAQGIEARYFESCDSTNEVAKKEAFLEKYAEHSFVLYIADQQTKGRGRGGNTWASEPGAALLCSWSFLLQDFPQPTSSPRLGLSLYRALKSTWPFLDFSLKAPNDVYLGDAKVAGLLIETISQGDDIRFIIGLGLNVISTPEIENPATSIAEEMPHGLPLLGEDWIGFLERLLFEITESISKADDGLSPSEQISLATILNQNPNLKDPILHVDENGTMKTKTKTIPWTEL